MVRKPIERGVEVPINLLGRRQYSTQRNPATGQILFRCKQGRYVVKQPHLRRETTGRKGSDRGSGPTVGSLVLPSAAWWCCWKGTVVRWAGGNCSGLGRWIGFGPQGKRSVRSQLDAGSAREFPAASCRHSSDALRTAIEKAARFWFAPQEAKLQARCGRGLASAVASADRYSCYGLRKQLKREQNGVAYFAVRMISGYFSKEYVRRSEIRRNPCLGSSSACGEHFSGGIQVYLHDTHPVVPPSSRYRFLLEDSELPFGPICRRT